MDTGETILTYRSKTITTQFCLKALVALSSISSLKDITIPQQKSFKRPEPKIYPAYKDFGRFLEAAEGKSKKEKYNLLNDYYINSNKMVFEELSKVSSLDQKAIIDRLISSKKDEYESLIEQVKRQNIIKLCKESINRCFEVLPLKRAPSLYLSIGSSDIISMGRFINNKPVIIIFLELWADVQSSRTPYQTYFKNRSNSLLNDIPLTIANQYSHIVLYKAGVLGKSFLDKLIEEGLSTYFSRMMFPDYPFSSHLFFTSAELEWCQRNEWFLKREIRPYLQSLDSDIINRYFFFNDSKKDKWFPDRVGYFVGYRIIEEYLENEYTLTISDLISESPQEIVRMSRYFNVET